MLDIDYSHRDLKFVELLKHTTEAFYVTFPYLREYDLLFIPGTGSTGMEAVIRSCTKNIKVVGPEGKFKDRWSKLAEEMHIKKRDEVELGCEFETSTSTASSTSYEIVDAISSFPYFSISLYSKIFVTCSNKQLGCSPGLAIVGVRKDAWDLIKKDSNFSVLNLWMYKENPIPMTMPVYLFEQLHFRLNRDEMDRTHEQISIVSEMFVEAFGDRHITGCHHGPTLTFLKKEIPEELAKQYELYGINNPDSKYYQIFTYSEYLYRYQEFIDDFNSSK